MGGNFSNSVQKLWVLFLPQVLVKITKILLSYLGYVAIGLCVKYLCYPVITTLAVSLNLDYLALIQAQSNSKSFNQLQLYLIPTPKTRWLLFTYLIQGPLKPWANGPIGTPKLSHSITTWTRRRGASRKSTLGHVTKGNYHVKCPQLFIWWDRGSKLGKI